MILALQQESGARGEEPDAEARFEALRSLVERTARRFVKVHRVPAAEAPAFEQAALVALWHCAQRFEDSSGASFRTYSYPRVLGALKDERRCMQLRRFGGELGQLAAPEQGQPEALAGELLARLPEAERKVLRWIYLRGFCLDVCAARLGVGKGWVTVVHKRGLQRLRRMAERQGGAHG